MVACRYSHLERKRYVYFWADGVYLNTRLGERQYLLVIIGATASGKKEVVAIQEKDVSS